MSEQIPPQLPPAELPPAGPDVQDMGSPLFEQIAGEHQAAAAKEQADREAAERDEADALGLPYMSPAERAHLENVANAQSVGELPDTVSEEDRRAATRGFHTSHHDADAHLEKLRAGARTQLEEFGNRRTAVERELMDIERKNAGDKVFGGVANGGYGSVDERVKAEMVKHENVKGNARVMLETNLRDQYVEEARRAADAAADAREAHINSRGGIGRLNTIDREDREAAEKAKRDAEELEMLEEAHAENDRRNAETRAWQERMGTGKVTGPTGNPGDVRPTVDTRTNAMDRPEGVSFKDWYNADPAERQRLVDEAADAELMKIANAVREESGEHPARGNARVPEGSAEAREPGEDDKDVVPTDIEIAKINALSAEELLAEDVDEARRIMSPGEFKEFMRQRANLAGSPLASPASGPEGASRRNAVDWSDYYDADEADGVRSGTERRLDDAEEAELERRRGRRADSELAGFTRRDPRAGAPEEQPQSRKRFAVAREVAKLIFHPDSWSGVHDEMGRTRIQRARSLMGKRALELLGIGEARDNGQGRTERMDDEDAVDAGFESAEAMEEAAEELRRPEPAAPVRPEPARVAGRRRPSPRSRRPLSDEVDAGLNE